MNRAERRKREREYKKEYKKAEQKKETLYSWLNTLSKDKYELIANEIKRQAIDHGNSVMDTMERCLKAVCIDELDMELEESQVFVSKVISYMEDDTAKITELRNMLGGNYMKTLEDVKNKMAKEAREMMEGGIKDKEIKTKLRESYQQINPSTIINLVKKVRTEYNKEVAADVSKVAKAIGIDKVTKEDLEKADIIESPTEPLEEEKTNDKELIKKDTKQAEKVQNEANNSIEIKSYKKSTTIEAQGKNYSYNIIKTEDKGGVYTDVIREDGVRFSNLEELEAYKRQAIEDAMKVINQEFEEGKAILNV